MSTIFYLFLMKESSSIDYHPIAALPDTDVHTMQWRIQKHLFIVSCSHEKKYCERYIFQVQFFKNLFDLFLIVVNKPLRIRKTLLFSYGDIFKVCMNWKLQATYLPNRLFGSLSLVNSCDLNIREEMEL